METKLEKFIKLRKSMFKTLLIFLFGGGSFLLVFAFCQIFIPNHQPVFLQTIFIVSGIFILLYGLIFLFCLPFYFIKWLISRKEITKNFDSKIKTKKISIYIGLGYIVLTAIFIVIITQFHLDAKKCDNIECFLGLANKCEAVKWQTTDGVGMEWKFYSSPDCRFEKQLLAITGNDSQEMKNILQGQGLTCDYNKNKFDDLWVNTLIYDLEPCNGELKESIAKLLLLL